IVERHRAYLSTALAVARIDEDWRAAFRALDNGLGSDNEQMALGVINLVTGLRGLPSISGTEDDETRALEMEKQGAYVRIGVAAANADVDATAAYTALLEGLESADPQMAQDVAVIVARMRGLPYHSGAGIEHESIAEQRDWVQRRLDEATGGAPGDGTTTPEVE
ncbi:MAG: hypothetical protein JW889_00920, partial [Verrucomicrobia bacterium]|nr:hypothetical protein [Verrucomicrobiota bacterium]